MPLGACAFSGTGLPIDRIVRRQLGFKTLTVNSIDSVSDRDFILEVLAQHNTGCALIADRRRPDTEH